MPSAFPAWILFTYCVLNSWIWIALGQGASYQKPLLEIIPSNDIIKRGNFTIYCSTPYTAVKFILYRERKVVRELDRRVNKAEFHFSNAQPEDSGKYTCHYNPTSDGSVYSDASDPITIEVRETFPKPSLQVSPGNVAVRGGTLTFRCTGERENMRFTLRHTGTTELHPPVEPLRKEAVFTITDVQREDEGSYDCYYQTKSGATVYSDPSDSIGIRVQDDDKTQNPDPTEKPDDERTTPKSTATADDEQTTLKSTATAQTTIIISVVCAALLLFFLLVIAILYSRRRQKKMKGDIQTKDLCLSEEKAASAPETMYAAVQKRKSPDAANVPEVQETEESEDQEGLTYVTINPESQKKKRAAQPRSDQDATVYAAINLR